MQDDSDNDQGFVANKITIAEARPTSKKSRNNSRNVRPLDFEPRYICNEGFLRKQPIQSFKVSDEVYQYTVEKAAKIKSKKPEQPQHPYKKYFTNQQFKLVYSRNKQKTISPDQINFCKNQVPLSSISAYDSTKYAILKPFQKNSNNSLKQQEQLQFDSRFECGNLQWAFKNKSQVNQYVMLIQNDTNTNGYNQWFNFSIRNGKPGVTYKFSIVNFKKRHSFFRYGKKLAYFSLKETQLNNTGWRYAGQNICYDKSPIGTEECKHFSLNFQLKFQYENDCVMVAFNFPYSYSKLIKKLKEIEQKVYNDQQSCISWQMKAVSYSLSNNAVPYITLTSTRKTQNQKKAIILLARQHPGQTWSSYLMDAFLEQITSQNQNSKWLLDNFVFKIFPMVNVDGVIYGNFRCDVGGFDMNRHWKYPSKILHPQIYAIRQEIQFIAENYEIVSCFDFHGHSKQYNTFCYSCKTDNVTCRVLPYILSQHNQGFHFPFCTFGISRFKESTARAVIFGIIKNPNVLTIECSFFGHKTDSSVVSYQPKGMSQMAQTLVKGIKIYYSQKQRKEAQKVIKSNLKEIMEYELKNGDEGGSESDPSCDQIQFQEKIGSIFPKSIISIVDESIEKYKKKPKITKGTTVKQKKDKTFYKVSRSNSIQVQAKQIQAEPQFNQKAKINMKRSIQEKTQKEKKKILQKVQLSQQIPPKALQPKTEERSKFSERSKKAQKFKQKSNSNANASFLAKKLDSSNLAPLKFKYQSQQLIREASPQSNLFNRTNYHPPSFNSTMYDRRLFFVKGQRKQKEDLPQLCILSEGKRKYHEYQNSKSKRQKIQSLNKQIDIKPLIASRNTVPINTSNRVDMYRKIKDKSKHNAQFLSKIWLQNLARFGKNMPVFMGSKGQQYLE